MFEGLFRDFTTCLNAVRAATAKLLPHLPKVLFCFSLILLSSLYTFIGARRDWFPFVYYEAARKTAATIVMQTEARAKLSERFVAMSEVPLKDITKKRIETLPAAENLSEH